MGRLLGEEGLKQVVKMYGGEMGEKDWRILVRFASWMGFGGVVQLAWQRINWTAEEGGEVVVRGVMGRRWGVIKHILERWDVDLVAARVVEEVFEAMVGCDEDSQEKNEVFHGLVLSLDLPTSVQILHQSLHKTLSAPTHPHVSQILMHLLPYIHPENLSISYDKLSSHTLLILVTHILQRIPITDPYVLTTLLPLSLLHDSIETLGMMIRNGLNPHIENTHMLRLAICYDAQRCTTYLLHTHRTDPTILDGILYKDLAAAGNDALLTLLLNYKVPEQDILNEALLRAVEQNWGKCVSILVGKGADVGWGKGVCWRVAAVKGFWGISEVLRKCGEERGQWLGRRRRVVFV